MKGYLLCFLLGCLLTSSLSQFVFSTSDNRYPSQITQDPRVKCSEEGSFPHPANCTWFYRCVDRVNSGVFQVFFFKCEPGTVFSDALDQCVFGSSNLCNAGQPITTGPGIVTGGPGSGPGVQPIVPEPPPGNLLPEPGNTIPESIPNPPVASIPPDVPQPGVPTTQSPVPPATIVITAETSTTTVLPPAPPPITTPSVGSESTIQCRNCVTKAGCKVGQKPFLVQLCDSCMFGNSGDYTTPKEECPYHPDPYLTSQGRCFSGLDLCPITRSSQQPEKPQEDEPMYTIRCSESQPRPNDQRIRELYCSDYHFCSPFGNYEGSQQLCSNFLQCYQNEHGYWEAELRNCLTSNLYSFDLDRCLPQPKETRLCRSI